MSIFRKLSLEPGLAFLWVIFMSGCAQSDQSGKPSGATLTAPVFSKQVIHNTFISEGVAVGDVNQDGRKDILAGFLWFEAPDWTPHEIMPPETYDYTKGYSRTFLNFVMDVNVDGRSDLIRIDFPGEGAYWYENPGDGDTHWRERLIDTSVCNESPMLADVDRDGRSDLVFGHESTGTMMWLRPPQKNSGPEWAWEALALSEDHLPGTGRFSHGLGFGDLNGDGREDIVIREGWWEAPPDRRATPWSFHQADLGEPCSQMYAFDFDADGDQDVISASAHAYGIWWHEQIAGEDGPAFSRHLIDSTFSQTHGVAFVDINADGLPDLITGKRFFAHQGKDPGGLEPAVLYWFELRRDDQGKPSWTPHLIDDDSGVGLQLVVEDMNEDNKPDIVVSNKKGVFCFLQE